MIYFTFILYFGFTHMFINTCIHFSLKLPWIFLKKGKLVFTVI